MLMKINTLQIQQIKSSHMQKPFNQTKGALEQGNIASVYVSHVLSIAKLDWCHMHNNTKLYPQQMKIKMKN